MQHAPTQLSILALAFLTLAAPLSARAIETRHFHMGAEQDQELALPFDKVGSIARSDLGTDGLLETVASAGPGEPPVVAILDVNGNLINQFFAYSESFDRGVQIAVGDITGDGVPEIVTGAMYGGGPHVRAFTPQGALVTQFFAYDEAFRGGVNVAIADTNGDGIGEIVTGAGIGGGPHVRIYNDRALLVGQFFAFDASDNSGVTITRMDHDQTGIDELVVGHVGYSEPEVRVVSFETGVPIAGEPFHVYQDDYFYGITLFPVNDNAFGVAPNGGSGVGVSMYTADGSLAYSAAAETEPEHKRILAAGPSATDLIILEADALLRQRLDKHIYVNLDEQRLYAYDEGLLQNTFLISAGRWPFRTPTGEFEVMRKLRYHDYRWSYGENDPRNYDLKNVEYNLEFTRHYYIHHAYWHSNWGNPMSHGCVNAPYEGVQWVYEWADVGTPVIVE